MYRLHQAFVLKPCQNAAQGRAADIEFLGPRGFRQARAGGIFQQANPVSDRMVDTFKPAAGGGRRVFVSCCGSDQFALQVVQKC